MDFKDAPPPYYPSPSGNINPSGSSSITNPIGSQSFPRTQDAYPPGKVFKMPTKWNIRQLCGWTEMNIQDEWGNDVFHAQTEIGKGFTGRRYHFKDLRDGEEMAYVKQKVRFNPMPKFEIYMNNNLCAVMAQKVTFTTPLYQIESKDNKAKVLIVGELWSPYAYDFNMEGVPVAKVKREFTTRPIVKLHYLAVCDSYSVEVQPGEDVIIVLAACIIIEDLVMWNDMRENSRTCNH